MNKARDDACGLVSFPTLLTRLDSLSRTCNDVGEFELERNPVFLLQPGETKGTQGLIKNVVSYSPAIDVLKLDWSEVSVV